MYKVGICGHFALGEEVVSGQVDKTWAVYNALLKEYGKEKIALLDTRNWQKNPLSFVARCRKLLKESENIIMMPSRNGFKVFPALFVLLNKQFRRHLHYIVVGAWLAERLEEKPALIPPIKKLDRVYAELEPLKDALDALGLDNTVYMPNFRETNCLAPNELVYPQQQPYRLCTFSRVFREKGIEEAVEAVRFANKALGKTAFVLDIYGAVLPEYEERFNELCKGFEEYISYKGVVNTAESTQTIKSCFALLFPTVCEGEGFAGTIVDAFAAGVPVIATDWHYNAIIVRNGVDGIIYDHKKPGLLGEILVNAAQNPDKINSMKPSCLERAAHFEADKAVRILIDELD